nr:hypothetical protein [Tanacetum cinerariifolium]
TIRTHDDEASSSRSKRSRQHETVKEAMLLRIYHDFLLWASSSRSKRSRQHETVKEAMIPRIYHDFLLWGGLHSDKNFNARDYWLSISSEEELHLSTSLALAIRSHIMIVLQKIITYGFFQRTTGCDKMKRNELWLKSMFEARHQNGYVNMAWLMAKCFKRKGVGSQRDNMICCGQIIMKLAKKMGLLTDEVLNSLSALTYCKALDATTLKELIDSEGRLIAEDPSPRLPRVAIPRGSRPSMQDLYDRMGNVEIRQGTLERMARRQLFHTDRYDGLFNHMAGHYGYTLQGAYAPPRTHDDEASSSRSKRSRQHETVKEAMIPRIYHDFLLWVLNNMGCAKEIEAMLEIKVYEVGGQEEIFNSKAWRRVFDINEPIYIKPCHEFYDDELMRGLHSDKNFNARDYWLSISSEEELHLSTSLALAIRSHIMIVLQKIITYGFFQRTTGCDKMKRNELWLKSMFEARHQNGYVNMAWLMAKCFKRKGVGSQRDNMICCGQIIMKLAKKMGLLTDEVLNSLSALTYCRALDATTLKELIDSEGRLIAEDPSPRLPRVAIPRGPRPSMQDLYDRMGNVEIRQGTLERMARRQLFHTDRYDGIFNHMAGHYGYTLQGAYAPPRYDEE